MTRLDRVLKLLEEYGDLAEAALCDILDCEDAIRSLACLTALRKEKEKLTQELIEHGCRRSNDTISQDIFSEKPAMKEETWCG